MTNTNIQIIPFSHEWKDSIKTLNYEWLEKYFRVEEGDYRVAHALILYRNLTTGFAGLPARKLL
jgi:hypothetical protein